MRSRRVYAHFKNTCQGGKQEMGVEKERMKEHLPLPDTAITRPGCQFRWNSFPHLAIVTS